jgi:hypothetical protein
MNRRDFFKATLATVGAAIAGKTLISEPQAIESQRSRYAMRARLVFKTHDSTYELTVFQGDIMKAVEVYEHNDPRITMHQKKLMVAHDQTIYAFALDEYTEVPV